MICLHGGLIISFDKPSNFHDITTGFRIKTIICLHGGLIISFDKTSNFHDITTEFTDLDTSKYLNKWLKY